MTEPKRLAPHAAVAAAVVAAELAFLLFFFSFDLPNSSIPTSPGKHVPRMKVWQYAIPGLVPDTSCLALDGLARVANVDWLVRLPIVGYALLIVLAGIAVGAGVLRLVGIREQQLNAAEHEISTPERIVMSFGLGMSLLSLVTLACGFVGWMSRPAFVAALLLSIFGLVVAAGRRWLSANRERGAAQTTNARGPQFDSRRSPLRWMAFVAGGITAALFLTISYLGAMLPATDFDVREYHLQGPKEFFLAGRVEFAPHNVYMNMPFGTEMLSLLGMIVAGDWWWGALVGQTVLATFAPMTALGIWSLARRLFGPASGWLGALIYLTTPWVYRISIIPYTENALCFFLLCALLAIVCATQARHARTWPRFWCIGGAMAGSAAACKYTALVSTVLPLGMIALAWPAIRRFAVGSPNPIAAEVAAAGPIQFEIPRRTLVRIVLPFAIGAAITSGPWFAKNWALTGNPVYPLLFSVFDGHNWTPEKNAKWEWGHRVSLLVALGVQQPPEGRTAHPDDPQHALSLRRFIQNVVDVTARADWQSPLVLGLAPLAFLRRPRGAVVCLWVIVGYVFMQWWLLTHRLDRFWVPLVPVASVLAGAGATWSEHRGWRSFLTASIVLVVFYNFSYCTTGLCGNGSYDAHLVSRADPLPQELPTDDRPVNSMNRQLPAGARVLAVGAADLFHLDRQVVYNTVFDDSIFERLARDRTPADVAAAFAEQGITHVYVNWHWVATYREPGNYGFTEFVTPSEFERLIDAGVLRRMTTLAHVAEPAVTIEAELVSGHELFEVAQQWRE